VQLCSFGAGPWIRHSVREARPIEWRSGRRPAGMPVHINRETHQVKYLHSSLPAGRTFGRKLRVLLASQCATGRYFTQRFGVGVFLNA
jgi:hypothetical protein